MPVSWKQWERPLIELDQDLERLRERALAAEEPERSEIQQKIEEYERRRDRYIEVMYSRLGDWEKVLVARAEPRPYTLDYFKLLLEDFEELEGDRRYGADHAIVGGLAFFQGQPVVALGHQKGRNIQERQFRNFAMAKPEGYRKAIRLMQMADRFGLPILSFVDTPAADPGVESEARGISEAIASAIYTCFSVRVPLVSIIIGEGGSGGAIAIAAGNRVLMQEHAIYSVIPPEGCAAILWRQPDKGPQAAAALKVTAQAAKSMNLIDGIIPEPQGGAHRNPKEAAEKVREAIQQSLADLSGLSGDELKIRRYERFRQMGVFGLSGSPSEPDPHSLP